MTMRRRSIIQAGGLWAASQGICAQPARKVYRVGILGLGSGATMLGPSPQSLQAVAFMRGMRELGYVYGEHFVTEVRGAERPDRYAELAAELVATQVDVIVAPGPAVFALRQATSTIPIIMTAAGFDPVSRGLVRSLARPGGNITGMSMQITEAMGKRLELLKELVPGAGLVAVLWDEDDGAWSTAEAAARRRGWKLLSLQVRDASAIEAAFTAASTASASAMLVVLNGVLYPARARVVELAARHRIPAMYSLRPPVELGGLMSYGPNIDEIWRQAAGFVDKILKGAKAGDLPVERKHSVNP